MKYLYCILISLCGFILLSCNDNDEEPMTYSCNNTIDCWVKENLSQIQKMSRSDWKKLPVQYSTATYVAFTKEQKKRFWKEKFEELKALPWNQVEINHIGKAEEFIMANPFIFSAEKMTMEELDKLELFCYKWCKYAEKHLKWDKQVAYSILATGYTPINTKGTIDINNVSSNKTTKGIENGFHPNKPETLKSCDCNLNCAMGCFPNNTLCENIPCKEDIHGCGWVLVQSCNGLCGGY